MRWTVLVFTCLPTLAGAEDWVTLDSAEITAALAARVLAYTEAPSDKPDLQDFFADGRTLFNDQWGRWDVRDGRYCSTWPPSERWSCFDVARRGLDIRFTSDEGEAVIGRYVDLN